MAYWRCQECDALNLYPQVNECETCHHVITEKETREAQRIEENESLDEYNSLQGINILIDEITTPQEASIKTEDKKEEIVKGPEKNEPGKREDESFYPEESKNWFPFLIVAGCILLVLILIIDAYI